MFKVPDWESDTPNKNAHFVKKANNKKSKNVVESVPKASPISTKTNTTNGPKTKVDVNINKIKNNNNKEVKIISSHDGEKRAKKRKLNNKVKVDLKSNGFNNKLEQDVVVAAKKFKSSQPQKTANGEAVLFTKNNASKSQTKKAKKPKLKKNALVSIPITDTTIIQKKIRKPDDNIKSKMKPNIPRSDINKDDSDTNVTLKEKVQKVDKKKEVFKKLLEKTQRNAVDTKSTSDKLRERMIDRLKAAQFRYLNEKLYTSSGNEAKDIFQKDPNAFHTYHQGYQQQLKKWPINPLDIIVKKILKMPKTSVIADMGCGEAALSKRVPHIVKSFDLVATAPGVVACDMAHTPLQAASVDVAVYCLALMGTELTQYLVEANRVLKNGGQLLIAEVESRFDDINAFAREVERLGFKLKSIDNQHSVFFFLHFVKNREPPNKKGKLPVLQLKPCLYKKR